MLSLVLLVVCGAVVVMAGKRIATGVDKMLVFRLAVFGYALRLAITSVMREVSFFSHEGGGDAGQYQYFSWYLVSYWERAGIHWIDNAEARNIYDSGTIGSAPGFVHLYALIQYVDGDRTRLGMVGVNAMLACLTFTLLHRFATELGSRPKPALWISVAFFFSPAFLFYSSDSYKDPWVIAYGLTCLYGCFVFLSQSVRRGLIVFFAGALCMWFTRRYVLYMLTLTMGVAIVLRLVQRGKNRAIAISLGLFLAVVAAVVLPPLLKDFGEAAMKTYETAIATNTRDWNERGGSGIDFDDGGDPYARIGPKLAYTLFSPFPWMSGSTGFHIGKIDALLMTFAIVRTALTVVRRWSDKRKEIVLLLAFIAPASFVYSLTMANIGLILRQRLVVEVAFLVLGSLSFVEGKEKRRSTATVPGVLPTRAAALRPPPFSPPGVTRRG